MKLVTPVIFTLSLALTVAAPANELADAVSIDGAVQSAYTHTWLKPRPVARPEGPAGGIAAGGVLSKYISANEDPEGDMPRDVAFTPDGAYALIANRDTDAVTFFDVNAVAITDTIFVGDFPVDIAVSPDGNYAVVPNVFGDSVSIIDLNTRAVTDVPVTGTQPYQVAVTADSAYAVVGVINDGVSSAFSIIDLASKSEIRSFASTSQGVFGGFGTPESAISGNIFTQFAVSSDSRTIVLPDRGGSAVSIYDLTTGGLVASLPTAAQPTSVDMSADGTTAIVAHEGNARTITEISLTGTPAVTGAFATNDSLVNQVVRITPDKAFAMVPISNNLIFVDLTSGATTATISTGTVGDIEVSADGQYAFVSNFNCSVINIATQARVRTITFAACVDAAASPVENRAVALNNRFRENIHLYNINGASGFFEGYALSGEVNEGDSTRALAATPDGRTVVAGNNTSENVTIFDMSAGEVRSYVDTGDRILNLAVTPDGQYAVVPNTEVDTVSIVDLSSDTVVKTLNVATRPSQVRISPDSTMAYVLTVAGTDSIHFIALDGPNSSVVGSIPCGQTGSALGYTYTEISGIGLTPDGSILAVCASFDDQLRLIDTATRSELVRVTTGDFPIRVGFSPDGTRAYVTNAFGDSVTVIDVDGANSVPVATVPGIDFPLTADVDASGDYVYVGNFGQNPNLFVIDTNTNTIARTVSLGGAQTREAVYVPAEGMLYLATTSSGGGALFRVAAEGLNTQVVDSAPLSGSPANLVYSPARREAVLTQPVPDGVDVIRYYEPGDMNCDGTLDGADIDPFFLALGDPAGYAAAFPDCDALFGDVNDDGSLDGADIDVFFTCLGSGCP